MKKSILFLMGLFTVLICAFLVGCGYTEEEKALMKEYEENSRVNAVNYIEEKYGFTADVVKTQVLKVNPGPVPDFTPAPSGYVKVTMKYNGKEFIAKVSGEAYNNQGCDNYQKDEILEAFKSHLEKEMSIKIENILLSYMEECLIDKKFTDIDSFLLEGEKRNPVSASIMTLDEVSEDTFKNITSTELEVLVISCDNLNDVEALKNIDYINKFKYQENFSNVDFLGNKLSEYALFMNGYGFKRYNKEPVIRSFEKANTEDGVIVAYDKNDSSNKASVKVTNSMAPAWDWSKDSEKAKSLPTFINPKKVSKDYAVDFGDFDKVQMFISKDKTDTQGKAQRYIAMQYIDENGKEIFDHIAAIEIGDYYSFSLKKQSDMKVTVMINENK